MTIKEIVESLDVIKFKYLDSNKFSFGVIAQEVEKIFPKSKYNIIKEDSQGYLMVDYAQITSLLLSYCKEQNEMIKQLENRISKLESKDNGSI